MRKISFMLMAMLLSMCIASCRECEDCEEKLVEIEPSAEFHFQFSSFIVRNGDKLTVTPTIVSEKSSPGLAIKKAGYYWDGQLISVVENPPFTLEYDIKDQKTGAHNVVISLICGGDGYVQMRATTDPYEVAVVE